jgi:lysozyme family protein
MNWERRRVLKHLAAATTSLLSRKALAQNPSADQMAEVVAQAQALGLADPVTAGPSRTLDSVDLADVILRALEHQESSEVLTVAQRAASLLRDLNTHDGYDWSPDEPVAAAPAPPYSQLRQGYFDLAHKAKIDASRLPELKRVAQFIASPQAKQRYVEVEGDTGHKIPWYVIGALHYREANLNFLGHLHNGDPLLQQTKNVPAGRPPAPWPRPDTDLKELWRISARDAVQRLQFLIQGSKVEQLLYAFESYNGFGCRAYGIPSPYLWNYTSVYTQGGFPRDHVFDPNYRSKQAGLFAIIVEISNSAPGTLQLTYDV